VSKPRSSRTRRPTASQSTLTDFWRLELDIYYYIDKIFIYTYSLPTVLTAPLGTFYMPIRTDASVAAVTPVVRVMHSRISMRSKEPLVQMNLRIANKRWGTDLTNTNKHALREVTEKFRLSVAAGHLLLIDGDGT
jgi:hypothetical protein